MSDALIVNVSAATFDTLCDGRLERQLQRALRQVADAFDDVDLQEGRSELDAKITVEIDLVHKIDSGATHLAGAVRVKLPGLRAVSGTAMLRGGTFLVEPDRQQDLPLETGRRGERS